MRNSEWERERKKEESHLVTLNEVLSYIQEGESFPHSYHKRWKIIMHIKVGWGGKKRKWSSSSSTRDEIKQEEEKIERIKKWKWKNVPVRDEIAACNLGNEKKRETQRGRGLQGEWRKEKIIIIVVKMWKGNRESSTESGWREGSGRRSLKLFKKRETLCQMWVEAVALQHQSGTRHILWLLHWYYYVVLSFGVKSFSIFALDSKRIIFIDLPL